MSDTTHETELERRLRERAAAEENPVSPQPGAALADPLAGDSAADTSDPDPLAALAEENAGLRDQLLRARAEFENFRKRTAREVERIRKTAAESVIHELLSALDNLELALKHSAREGEPLSEGVKLVHKQIVDVLERNGLEKIDAKGARFDPNIHEAVAQSSSESVAEGNVIEEFQRGYRLGGQILRPSKVLVSTGPEASARES